MEQHTLKYRAILIDDGNTTQERPLQVYASHRSEIDRWAGRVLENAVSETAVVTVHQTTEQQIAIIQKPKKQEPKK